MSVDLLKQAVLAGELRPFDVQFAEQIMQCNGVDEVVDELLLATALVSHQLSRGDTCIRLDQARALGIFSNREIKKELRKCPSTDRWRSILLQQIVVGSVPDAVRETTDHPITPLLLDEQNRLYLARYWHYEQSLLKSVRQLLATPPPATDGGRLVEVIARLYPDSGGTNWQKVATALAALSSFCVITGGPGTGKTYTVASLLAVFEAISPAGDIPRVMLAAPTGKAATRLTESLQGSKYVPDCYRGLEAVTIHRLLGMIPGRLKPRFNSQRQLRLDVLVIDEASMIDLPMMTRVLDAIPAHCRLILLGDKNQLASVESGMVLGDICGPHLSTQLSVETCQRLEAEAGVRVAAQEGQAGAISDRIVYLTESRRSEDRSGIVELSNAINRGDVKEAFQYLNAAKFPDLQLLDHSSANLEEVINRYTAPAYQKLMAADTPAAALEHLSDTCILCALRRGRTGAEGVNRRVESALNRMGVISADEPHYAGRPVMVSENSPSQGLFNGDVGITLLKDGKPKVYFQGESTLRAFVPARLPQHQTFYAMTVHKSQGSEYSTVILILPDSDNPLLTRELLYTGVTRARERVIIVANRAELETAINTRSMRQSGILDALWPGASVETGVASRARFDGKPEQTEMEF
jgi:exodeoxyribonuclease V alpha subunit